MLSYPLFHRGIRYIQARERTATQKKHQLQLMKDQLAFSRELEKTYQTLRKWNHDVENHLLSLSYLMTMKKYREAVSYCCSMALSPVINAKTNSSGLDGSIPSSNSTAFGSQPHADACIASPTVVRNEINEAQNKCLAKKKNEIKHRQPNPQKSHPIRLKYNKYLFFIAMACMQFFWFLGVFPFFFKETFLSVMLLTFFSMAALFQIYLLIMQVLDDAHTDIEIAAIKKQAALREEHSAMLSEHQKETLHFSENMQERLEVFQSLLTDGNYEEANSCLLKTISTFQQERYHPCCQNNLLNAILDGKKKLASREQIRTDYEILLPNPCPIPDTDLSSIIFNLLDNGIEACIHSGSRDPFIRLSIYQNKDFLTFHMENSKNPDIPFTHNTTKEDSQSHGLGLSIIEEISEKYDGTYQWQDLGNKFDSIVLLRMSQ